MSIRCHPFTSDVLNALSTTDDSHIYKNQHYDKLNSLSMTVADSHLFDPKLFCIHCQRLKLFRGMRIGPAAFWVLLGPWFACFSQQLSKAL